MTGHDSTSLGGPGLGIAPPDALRRRVSDWGQRRAIDSGRVESYSRMVGILKMALPAVALFLVAAVLLYSFLGQSGETMQLTYERMSGEVADDMMLVKPKLTGTDGRNQPFTVTAASARQDLAKEPGKIQKLAFTSVVGDIVLADKSWIALESRQGQLDGEAKRLDMTGGLNIYSDRGYECRTEAAVYNIAKGVLSGSKPIECHGPMGLIKANGFEGTKTSGQMKFTGGVWTQFYPPGQSEKKAAKPEAAAPVPASAPTATQPAPAQDGSAIGSETTP